MTLMTKPHEIRRKKFVCQELQAPFPAPIASVTGQQSKKNFWYQFTGKLFGDHIMIMHSGDIQYLNDMGFFGRGLLSRGMPEFYKSLPSVVLPGKTRGQPDRLKVMRKRMYLRHMKWRKSCAPENSDLKRESVESDQSDLDQEFDSDLEYMPTEYETDQRSNEESRLEEDLTKDTANEHHVEHVYSQETSQDTVRKVQKEEVSLNDRQTDISEVTCETESSLVESFSSERKDEDTWNFNSSNQKTAVESWDTMAADGDFWASECTSVKTEANIDKADDNFSQETMGIQNNSTYNSNSIEECGKGENTDIFNLKETAADKSLTCVQKRKNCETVNETDSQHDSLQGLKKSKTDDKGETSVGEKSAMFCETSMLPGLCSDDLICDSMSNGNNSSGNELCSGLNVVSDVMSSDIISGEKSPPRTGTYVTQKDDIAPLHPYCDSDADCVDKQLNHASKSDGGDRLVNCGSISANVNKGQTEEDKDSDYLVIEDSDIDDGLFSVEKKNKYRWNTVKKKDPYQFNEPLVLTSEEAFFLSYGLGCLTVMDDSEQNLTLPDLWKRFCSRRPRFLPLYAVYHFLRSKGWVPKPGILFGVDFILYKIGPPFYHATYSVIVKVVREGDFQEVEEYTSSRYSCETFAGVYRITEHVAKTLMICYVVLPQCWENVDKSSPNCLKSVKIRLQYVNRWVSSQEREGGTGEDTL